MQSNPNKLLKLITGSLLTGSSLYLIKGFYLLVLGNYRDDAGDLRLRWREQQYIYQGIYPYDVIPGTDTFDPDIGAVRSGGYFPWSFFAQYVFIPDLPWPTLRIYFALLNVMALGVLGWFAYRTCRPYGKTQAWFAVAMCLSMGSYSTTLKLGQYGIITNALLVGAFWCLQRRKQIWAGLLLSLALTKLNIGAFYPFIPLVLMQFRTLQVLGGYLVVANLSIWAITKVSPIYMIYRIYEQSKTFASTGKSAVSVLVDAGLNAQLITVISALAGLFIVLSIFYFWRNCSLLALFATAAVMGRVAFYHWHYDNLMLFFLLLFLLQITLLNPSKFNISILGVMMLSLSIPAKVVELPYMQNFQFLIWVSALGYGLFQEKNQLRKVAEL